MSDAPVLVTLHVWGFSAGVVPGLMARLGRDRRRLRRAAGVRFAKILGTAAGAGMRPRDADLRHWAALLVWDSLQPGRAAQDRVTTSLLSWWDARAYERLDVWMRPLASRGRWSGAEPFDRPAPTRHEGPVAAVTRARLALRRMPAFYRAAPAVAADLDGRDGLLLALGIGEAPIGLQGTFSLWRSSDDLTDFAHRGAAHADVVRRTPQERWYAEELFARFAVLDAAGTYRGRPVRACPPGPTGT